MKKLLQPKVILPAFLSIGLLAGLLTFGDIRKTVGLMANFKHIDLLWFVCLVGLYELVRGYQWHFLLKHLGIHVPLKGQVFAFLLGEITKNMPIGNYFQNYVLQEVGDEDFGRTSAATTLVVFNEVAVSIVGVVLIGVGTWNSWLRPTIVVGLLAFSALVWGVYRVYRHTGPPKWVTDRKHTSLVWRELVNFRGGARDLIHPRILCTTFALTSVYSFIAGFTLYVTARGIGIHAATLLESLSVYLFGLGFSLTFPVPVDIGITEVSMVGAFLAVGVGQSRATGAVLIFRALNILSAIFIVAISLVFLHEELRLVLRGRGRNRQDRERAGEEESAPNETPKSS